MSIKRAKNILGLRSSLWTIGKYLKKLGWRKIKTKYCQFVREINQFERVLYAHLCQASGLDFNDSIFIDETTRQCGLNAPLHWFHYMYSN